MRLAYFDCSYGVAGDMLVGALVDAGAPFARLKREIESGLGVAGIRLSRRKVQRAGVVGTRVVVHTDSVRERHRRLGDIERVVRRARLSRNVKERCLAAFRRLAEAEAKVHRSTPEAIHFHEVGCLDAIADVVAAMLALELLAVERVEASRVVVGSGSVRSGHGFLPVPGPATVELLRDVPCEAGPHAMEMTTPTGAAVLTTVAERFGPQPLMTLRSAGYGAGMREIEGHPNFLRVLIGDAPDARRRDSSPSSRRALPVETARLALLMTEIDDMNPEVLGDFLERLFRAGCLDAHFTPIQMKKNRPAIQLQVLCRPEQEDAFIEMILRETSTFGLKVAHLDRACLKRRMEKLATPLGLVDVKIGLWGDETLKATPEYESCRRIAASAGLPLAEVYRRVEAEILRRYFPPRRGPRPKATRRAR